ncbi:cohesin domain-containing protein [Halopiger xanaduensis]|uniref:Cellulosome anchoring protein cohesin region n=1 Tax=Halopiger xanaduensis (strain DSM 18323 / JCM 14033 / SH-6) TaxID=797210 RepID=F8D6G0_HALXS|nr:cohesin domain-containing protein [Halopiger xanaduensis]AEH36547.1 cellulosome anchoring protein cohesin region [Halopiger xanaduensis SH-6]
MIVPTRARRAVSLAALATLVTALCVTTAVGTAAAGDQTAIVWSEPETVAAEPGETVELEVVLQSGGSHDAGVEAVTLVAQYHPDYLSVVDVERGPWLAGGGSGNDGDGDVRTAETIADENGTAILEQRRDPAAGGVSGVGTVATVTVEVAEDAPAATTDIAFDATDVSLTSEWPTPVVDEPTTIEIDGGGERVAPDEFEHPDPDEFDLEETAEANSTTGDGADDGDENESTGSGPAETTDATESIPGFTIAGTAAVSAVLAVTGAFAARRNRSRR